MKVRELKYVPREVMQKYRSEFEQGEEEAVEVGRSGWDMLQAFVDWVKSIVRWIALIVMGLIVYFVFGWVAMTGMLLGTIAAYVIGTIFLHGRYEYVDVYDDEYHWDTYEVGVEAFKEMHHEGGLSPVSSSRGNIRYLCEEFNQEAGVMRSAWVGELSSFNYLMDMRTHKRLLAFTGENMDKWLDAIGYSSVYGKVKAGDVMRTWIDDYDKGLMDLKGEYSRMPDATHELVETSFDKVRADESGTEMSEVGRKRVSK